MLSLDALLAALRAARLLDLAQPCYPGMPHWPTHPPFALAATKEHGDFVLANGASSSAELIALGTHVGTHIDALCHFSLQGRFHRGLDARALGVDTLAPLVARGLLFDAAPGGELGEDAAIGAEELAAGLAPLEPRPGDVVLVRTGWGRRWRHPRRFLNGQRQPGLSPGAARWLSARGVRAVGADNVALERIPSAEMPVHVHLLVEAGVLILECLNLEALAEAGAREFLFFAAPLRIEGATGSPVRPFALLP
ncbi:MAG: cyclase family protein [Bryobacteraceae bacterium]|nr:cyclase family protein [Bryobacteraceae bacterium]